MLSGENAELRRELLRASELGEALESQQRAAEERMHKLEEERAWLTQRLAQCEAAAPRPALDVGTGVSNGNSGSFLPKSASEGFSFSRSSPGGVDRAWFDAGE